jgi:hypothetical protein
VFLIFSLCCFNNFFAFLPCSSYSFLKFVISALPYSVKSNYYYYYYYCYYIFIRKDVVSINEVCLFTHISNIGLLILIPMTIVMEGSSILKLGTLDINSWNLCLNFLVNGVAYSVYNLMSFLVLSRTDLVTHAVLNVFRRVFIIIFTSYYFVQYLSALNIFGIFLAVVGVVLFSFSRSKEKESRNTTTMTEK